ncbi:MAG: radical SAM protein [Desulfurellales bacterium]|nr:MAG: radical SAM protein [Desulfurellales bacterium]
MGCQCALEGRSGETMRKQEAPFCVQVELVEGCNLFCNFCGLQGIREKPGNYRFADLEMLEDLAEQIASAGWTPRIEFAMHGEPSMHPQREAAIRIFREHLPKAYLMMTSNGGGFLKGGIAELFDAGLDTLALDNYEYVKIVPKLLPGIEQLGIPVFCYPNDKRGNPHNRWPTRRITIIEDISKATSGTNSSLNSHCGAAFDKKALMKPCAKPFREISVRHDGSVAICCNDWRGELPMGNIKETLIDEIWTCELMERARRLLYLGRREFTPCDKCDAKSTRTGLLPDRLGKERMPKPQEDDLEVLSKKRGYLTLPVLRPWEKTQ